MSVVLNPNQVSLRPIPLIKLIIILVIGILLNVVATIIASKIISKTPVNKKTGETEGTF